MAGQSPGATAPDPRLSGRQAELAAAAAARPNEAPALAAYRAAALALATADGGDGGARLLDALIARDALALRLERDPPLQPAEAHSLIPLDAALREVALLLLDGPDARAWRAGRDSLAPDSDRWWWTLDQEVESRHQLWSLLTRLALLASVVLALDLLLRFWGNAGAIFTLFSFLLTLAAATPLTAWGRRQVDRALEHRALDPAQKRRRRASGALLVLALVLLLRIWLPPTIARYTNARGVCFYAQGALPAAVANFERARLLDPGLATASYNLGAALEDSYDYAGATAAYLRAGLIDPGHDEAINNLARLLLIQEDAAADGAAFAAQMLDRAAGAQPAPDRWARAASNLLCLVPIQAQVAAPSATHPLEYRLLTNHAWALLQLGHFDAALAQLDAADAVHANGAAAHCIRALTLEALARDSSAAWDICFRNPDGDRYLQPDWIATAKERHESD